jgi:hypothetical protein
MNKTCPKLCCIAIYAALMLFLSACHKEGAGGKASLSGTVKHHSQIIPNCLVYIKYGATEFPGSNVNNYDDHVVADGNGHYEFKSLYKGDYYLYCAGYDATIMENVYGGLSVNIKKNQNYEVDIPVTE